MLVCLRQLRLIIKERIKVYKFWEGKNFLRDLNLTFDLHHICRTKIRWRFLKIWWPSQNIWTLSTLCHVTPLNFLLTPLPTPLLLVHVDIEFPLNIIRVSSRLKYSISLSIDVRDARVANNGFFVVISIQFTVCLGYF